MLVRYMVGICWRARIDLVRVMRLILVLVLRLECRGLRLRVLKLIKRIGGRREKSVRILQSMMMLTWLLMRGEERCQERM